MDTIAALATPLGYSGIAVIRVSGSTVRSVMPEIVGRILNPREATYLAFRDKKGQALDEGIAIFFPAPHSFTGEDVLELQSHGGFMVVDMLLQRLLQLGARLARPGEFSERAFLNGKMDLTQAEAISDLIYATSQQAARSAVRSLQGEFSKEIHALNEKLIYLRTYIEAAIDFSEEDINFLNDGTILTRFKAILDDLAVIQQKAKQGSLLREGLTVVIMGEPNVGKSSLLNALSGKDIAIVTDIPGTTRDVLRDIILIDGLPLHIIDTAGLRQSDDVVEQEGIRRAYQARDEASIVLYVLEAISTMKQFSRIAKAVANDDQTCIFIRNKIDLTEEAPSITVQEDYPVIALSVKSGDGLDLLKKHIKSCAGFESQAEGIFIARRRHLEALAKAESHIDNGLKELSHQRSAELIAEDLRLAQQALNEVTGEFTADDLLGRIFSSFCVGK